MDVRRIVHTPKGLYKVEGLHPRSLTIILAYLDQLLSQPSLSFFYPEVVRCLPQGLRNFLGCSSGGFGLLQLSFKVQDQLLLCGQLYLIKIELFALIFSLVRDILQPSLSAPPRPLLNSQLAGQLLVFLLHGSQGLVGLGAEVGLNPSLILGVLDPFFIYKNLLENLHKNDKGIPCKKTKEKVERIERAP